MFTSKNIYKWSFSNTKLNDYIKQCNHTYMKKMLEYNNQSNSKIIMAENNVKTPPNKYLLFRCMFLSVNIFFVFFYNYINDSK